MIKSSKPFIPQLACSFLHNLLIQWFSQTNSPLKGSWLYILPNYSLQ